MKNKFLASVLTMSMAASVLAGLVGAPAAQASSTSYVEAEEMLLEKVAGRIPPDTWTAREVPEGTVVTLKPDYSEDWNVETSTIKGGGFESTNGWSDALNTLMFWQDGGGETNPAWKPWTFSTDVKIEGNQSGCVDVSSAMAELSGQIPDRLPFMGFTNVNVEPCFDNQAYRLRFYVKADRELGVENPLIMVYLIATDLAWTGVNGLEKVIGTTKVMLDASNIDYHWYDQNEIAFKGGMNPTGTYPQGYGPFYQGKWIQIDAYFVTPEDFNEGAYDIQIHTQKDADCKLYFDAFSLEKITMDEVDLGVGLRESLVTERPTDSESTVLRTPTPTPTATVPTTPSPSPTASVLVSGDYEYKVKHDQTVEITKYNGKDNIVNIPATINGLKVTSIGDRAFANNNIVQSVIMPDTLTKIGNYAFESCGLLNNVAFNDSLTHIGDYAFYNCRSFWLVVVPESVTYIGDYAFGYDDTYTLLSGFSMTGYDGSATEKYANDNKIAFLNLSADNSDAPVKKFKFTKKSVKIKKGKKVTLKVKITGAKKVTFSVDKKGKKVVKLMKKAAKSVTVKGKKKGKATITAKAAGKTAKCKVTVK